MWKLIEILPNALTLGCQKIFKSRIGAEFCGNWRNFKKNVFKLKKKRGFSWFFMKNIYENTIGIPIGIKIQLCSNYKISIEDGHQNTVNWWLDRFETPKMKASGWFRVLCETRFINEGSSYFLEKTRKTQKIRFSCHFFVTFGKSVPTDKISKSQSLVIFVFFVTNRHFLLENWKSCCILGEELDHKWRKVDPRLPIAID